MAKIDDPYEGWPSKQNPYGTNEAVRAGQEFRRIVDSANTVEEITASAASMYDRGFMRVPGEMVIRAISDFNDRQFKEAMLRQAAAKQRVSARIKSAIRLATAFRKATRNHVRGWA